MDSTLTGVSSTVASMQHDFMYGYFKGKLASSEYDAALASGSLSVGCRYEIVSYETGDDFTNVSLSGNDEATVFRALEAVPTVWSNGSILKCYGDAYIQTTVESSIETGMELVFERESAGVWIILENNVVGGDNTYGITKCWGNIPQQLSLAYPGGTSYEFDAFGVSGPTIRALYDNSGTWEASDVPFSDVPLEFEIFVRDIK